MTQTFRQIWRFAALAAALLFPPQAALALKFAPIKTQEGGEVLLAYDCGVFDSGKEKCAEFEKSIVGPSEDDEPFYVGDSARLEQWLTSASHHFSRVLLYSGGGSLNEGIAIGRVLRRHRQYVVVPRSFYCVSSCTVAFLGGVIRDIEAGATYQVHAASRYLEVHADDRLARYDDLKLADEAKRTAMAAHNTALQMFVYVQEMIGGQPNPTRVKTALDEAPDPSRRYIMSPELKSDVDRVRRDGPTAYQEVMMRLERDSFDAYLGALQERQSEMGTRADKAVKMLQIMYSSRITGTFSLDDTTLREMGYVNARH